MRIGKIKLIGLLLCLLTVMQTISCEYITSLIIPGSDEQTTAPETTEESESIPEGTVAPGESETLNPGQPITLPIPNTQKEFINPFTGLPSAYELSESRAVAFVIDNNYLSFPQSGIEKADVLCEFVLPDGNTSLMAIFKDSSEAVTIGPLGVATSLAVDFADCFDAIVFARKMTDTVRVTLADPKTPIFTYEQNKPSYGFYESADRKNTYGYAYSVMAEGVRLLAAVANQEGFTKTDKSFSEIFRIYSGEREYIAIGANSKNIYIPISESQCVQLVYSESEKMYYRYAFGSKLQVDDISGNAVAFKNVFILTGTDDNSKFDVEEPKLAVGQRGSGYFASCGRYINITWVKTENGAIRFYNEDGTTFDMPAGKSYISFVSRSQLAKIKMNYSK
jgi:hypothetical protein